MPRVKAFVALPEIPWVKLVEPPKRESARDYRGSVSPVGAQ